MVTLKSILIGQTNLLATMPWKLLTPLVDLPWRNQTDPQYQITRLREDLMPRQLDWNSTYQHY